MDRNVLVTLDQFEAAEKYWLEKLSGEPGDVRLHPDFPRTGEYESAVYKPAFDTEVTEHLLRISKNNNLSLYIVLLTFYKILLFKYTYPRQTAVITASPVYSESSRKYNTFVAFRDTFRSSMTFKEALMEVKQTVIEGYKNEHYPFSNLSESLGLNRDSVSLFTRHAVILEDIHKKESIDDFTGDIAADIVFALRGTRGSAGGLEGEIIYNAKLFTQESIRYFFAAYHRILEQMTGDTGKTVGDVELITAEEKEQLLSRFNDTGKEYPENKPIHRLFEEQVEQTPANTAVSSTIDVQNIYDRLKPEKVDVRLSYEELNGETNFLARELIARGVRPGSIVGLIVRHPIELVKGILGILKAGGAYLPIDPHYPRGFREYILQDVDVPLVVSETALLEILPGSTAELSYPAVLIDDIDASHDDSNPAVTAGGTDAAYVIYTSGTTGKAKGTLIPHRGIVNYALWRLDYYGYTETDVTLQPLSAGFDGFGSNFYSSLLSGGELVMVPDSRRMDYDYIKEAITENRVTNMSLVPGIYGVLLETTAPEDLDSLRFVVLAGESCPPGVMEKSKEKAPHCVLINEYGPTEASVTAAARRDLEKNRTTVIGKPISNTRLAILDTGLSPVPVNAPGELHIGGRGLAHGYLNNPELTAQRFCNNRSDKTYKSYRTYNYFYKTGDLARWLPDGNIEFLGRADHQVKIRGHRIELGQVEAQLAAHPDIKSAVVSTGEKEGTAFLCAYIVPRSPQDFKTAEFREYLDERLPYYMVPSYFVPLEEIPLTRNGKPNRAALPQPDTGKTGEEYMAPSNQLEEQLAGILKEVLRLDRVGVNDNFFDIGGNSINFVRVNSKLKEVAGKEIPIVTMFQYPTIRTLCAYLTHGEAGKKDEAEALKRVEDTMEEAVELFDNL